MAWLRRVVIARRNPNDLRKALLAHYPGGPGTNWAGGLLYQLLKVAWDATADWRCNDETTQTLPLLPLTSGVVLPGMGFTIALETEEARVAAEAAGSVGSRLVLVPHIEGRYAAVGVVAEIP